jgi:cephalosporin-C deacetylase-like acetyl esterase
MNKLIAVEAILLVIISFLAVSYLATGTWKAQAPSQVSSFNTTFWDLGQDYPDLNEQLVFVTNSTSGNTTINQYDIWFDSHYYGNDTVRIHAILLVPNATLPYGGCTLVNCTCVNGSNCNCLLQCNSTLAPHDMPAILLLHGTNGSASDMLDYGRIWASKGYVALAMDSPGCGNSSGPKCIGANFIDFTDGPYSSYYYHNVIAASRAITMMAYLPFVNGSAMGASGASMGGLTTFLLSAVDGRVKAGAPVVAAGYLDESMMRGSLINFIMPKEISMNDPKVKEFVSYFDPRGYVSNMTVPTLMLVGTHDEFFFLDSVNKTFGLLATPKGLDLAPNQGHSFTLGWVESASIWFDHYLTGSNLTLPAVPKATVESVFLSSALSIGLIPASLANYTPVVFYRYTLPGSLWTEISPGAGQTIPLLPLTSNVEYYVGVKSGGSLVSTSPVYIVPATSSFFWIAVIFLILILVILGSNWREEIWAYAASDIRGTILFVIGAALWLVAAYSMTLPWLSIPGKASLSLLQLWDAYAIHLPGFWIVLAGMGIALFAYLARMWIGGIILVVMAIYLYFQLVFVSLAGVEFSLGIYLFGTCAAISLLIPALVKILRD